MEVDFVIYIIEMLIGSFIYSDLGCYMLNEVIVRINLFLLF